MNKSSKRKTGKKQSGKRRESTGTGEANLWEQGVDEIISRFSRIKDRYFLPRFLRQMKKLNTGGLSGGNSIEIITDGDTFFNVFTGAIESARKSINLETYIFNSDETGWEMARLLVKKAAAGIEVNCIYDAVGCIATSPALFSYLREGGVEIIEYHPILPWRKSFTLGLRDHRKILVIDGETAFVGGNNIGNEYAGTRFGGETWRDTHAKIEGPAVRDIQYLFMENWYRCGGAMMNLYNHFNVLPAAGKKIVMVLGSRLRKGNIKPIIESYVSAINNAREKIFITNAYFVPNSEIFHSLVNAAERGIDVRIMMPQKSDIRIVRHAGHYLYKRYLKKGIRLFEYTPAMLHAKTAVIDGIWSTIGSSNLDGVTIRRNIEINVVVLDQEIGEMMEEIYFLDMSRCHEITMNEWHKRSMVKFLVEWLSYHLLKLL